jgi:hypothetical protein
MVTATHPSLISRMMTPKSQFGIACKTCRRRGRKCDRTLPKCMSCHQRGVECEGYTLRWINQSAANDPTPRKEQASVRLSSKTNDPYVSCVLPQRLDAARVLEGEAFGRQYSHSANSTSRGDETNLHLVTSPRRPTWTMPATLLPPDSVQVFVNYCKENSSWRNLAITHGL